MKWNCRIHCLHFVPAAVPCELLGMDRVAIGVAAFFARESLPLSEVSDDEDTIMDVSGPLKY